MKVRRVLKQISVFALIGTILATDITPAYATNSVGAVNKTQDVSTDDTAECEVYAELGTNFRVIIPKKLTLDGVNKKGAYTVDVEGDIGGTDTVKVVPEESFTLTSTGLADQTATVSQDKTAWSWDEILAGSKTIGNGSISAGGITAGTWNGSFWFNISLEEGTGSEGGGTETQSKLTLSESNVAMGTEDSVQVNAYLDGVIANDEVSWSSDNENIIVTNGLVETTANAQVGDTATVTVTASNTENLSAMANVLSDLEIVTYASAAEDLSIDFVVTIVDIEYSVEELNLKAGESIDVTARIIPDTVTGTVTWSQTAIGGINLVKNGNTVTVKVASDMEAGKSYNLVATYGDYSKTLKINIVPDHTHSYESNITTEATCTTDGVKTFTCECGDSYTEVISATGHSWEDDYTVDVEATCTTEGSKSIHCANCDATRYSTTIPVLGHNLSSSVTKESTCTEEGNKHFECSRCDYEYDEAITAKGHTYTLGKYVVDTEATCTKAGSKSVHCDVCDAKIAGTEVEISATGHSYDAGVVTTEPTCTEDGVKTFTCSKCNGTTTESVNKLGHNYSSVVTEPTCTEKGYTTHTCSRCNDSYVDSKVSATGHSFDSPIYVWSADRTNCTATRVCSNDTTHKETESATVTSDVKLEATCTTKGTTTYTATFNNTAFATQTSDVEDIDALGHNYSSTYTVDKAATCIEAGSKSRHCSRCSATTDITEIPAGEHNYVPSSTGNNMSWLNTKNGTYAFVQDGTKWTSNNKGVNSSTATSTWVIDLKEETEYSFIYKVSSETNYDKLTITLDGTTIANAISGAGSEITYTKTLSAGTHTIEAKYTKDGSSARGDDQAYIILKNIDLTKLFHKCNVCGQEEDHNYDEGVVTKAATCTEDGIKTFTCCCGGVYTEVLPATGHNYVNDVCAECGKEIEYTDFTLTSSNYSQAGITRSGNVVIPKTFEYNGVKYKVTSIGADAFYGCTSLTSITIPDSVTSIGHRAFCDCTNLTSVTIPDSVTSLDTYAFRECTSLTSVTIPDSVTSMESEAFYKCTGLTSVTIGNGVTSIDIATFEGCTNLTSVTIGNGVTSISNSAFSGCTSLSSVTIPDSVTSIGNRAFKECTSLTSATIGNGVTSIGEDAFWCCKSLTSVTIGNGVTSIGNYAFYQCTDLTNVTIPNSVTSIGNSAFAYCTSLTSVTIPDSVTSIGSYAFDRCSSLTSITIPDSVTSIGSYAFYCCTSLTSVTIGNGVTSIGDAAFSHCTGLISVTIPDSVTSIGRWAFDECTSLTSVTFKTTSGWYVGSSAGSKSTAINNSDLANTSTAATYLKSTYRNYYWSR